MPVTALTLLGEHTRQIDIWRKTPLIRDIGEMKVFEGSTRVRERARERHTQTRASREHGAPWQMIRHAHNKHTTNCLSPHWQETLCWRRENSLETIDNQFFYNKEIDVLWMIFFSFSYFFFCRGNRCAALYAYVWRESRNTFFFGILKFTIDNQQIWGKSQKNYWNSSENCSRGSWTVSIALLTWVNVAERGETSI